MPASRSARAIILAPRSCPSRPGLAISTRILRSGMVQENTSNRLTNQHSGNRDFLVGSENGAQGATDFAESGVSFDGIVDARHEIFRAFGSALQGVELVRSEER